MGLHLLPPCQPPRLLPSSASQLLSLLRRPLCVPDARCVILYLLGKDLPRPLYAPAPAPAHGISLGYNRLLPFPAAPQFILKYLHLRDYLIKIRRLCSSQLFARQSASRVEEPNKASHNLRDGSLNSLHLQMRNCSFLPRLVLEGVSGLPEVTRAVRGRPEPVTFTTQPLLITALQSLSHFP